MSALLSRCWTKELRSISQRETIEILGLWQSSSGTDGGTVRVYPVIELNLVIVDFFFRVHRDYLILLGLQLCHPLIDPRIIHTLPIPLPPTNQTVTSLTSPPSLQICRLRPGRRVPSSATSPDQVGGLSPSHCRRAIPSQPLLRHRQHLDGTPRPRPTRHRISHLSTPMRSHTSMRSPPTGGILMAPPGYFIS